MPTDKTNGTTRDTARRRLFGGGAPVPAASPAVDASAPDGPPAPEQRSEPERERKPEPKRRRVGKKGTRKASTPNTGNALGGGLYLYRGDECEKLSVYVPKGTKAVLKSAGFSPDDDRGGDMSQIVQTLLRQAGYIT